VRGPSGRRAVLRVEMTDVELDVDAATRRRRPTEVSSAAATTCIPTAVIRNPAQVHHRPAVVT